MIGVVVIDLPQMPEDDQISTTAVCGRRMS